MTTNLDHAWRDLQHTTDTEQAAIERQIAEVTRLRQELLAAIAKLESMLGIHRG